MKFPFIMLFPIVSIIKPGIPFLKYELPTRANEVINEMIKRGNNAFRHGAVGWDCLFVKKIIIWIRENIPEMTRGSTRATSDTIFGKGIKKAEKKMTRVNKMYENSCMIKSFKSNCSRDDPNLLEIYSNHWNHSRLDVCTYANQWFAHSMQNLGDDKRGVTIFLNLFY